MPAKIEYRELRHGYWTATLGPWEAGAKTKSGARQALLAFLARQPEDNEPDTRVDERGNPWTLWWDGTCWAYRTPTSALTRMNGTRDECIERMLQHMRDYCA